MSDDNTLAGASSDGNTQDSPRVESSATEVHPVKFDKDYKDFRATSGDEVVGAPKGWSVRESVSTSTSVTGLEDVSPESSESPVQTDVTKENLKKSSESTDSGKPTSSKETSTGKQEPPAPV